jgi:hypothetical protein
LRRAVAWCGSEAEWSASRPEGGTGIEAGCTEDMPRSSAAKRRRRERERERRRGEERRGEESDSTDRDVARRRERPGKYSPLGAGADRRAPPARRASRPPRPSAERARDHAVGGKARDHGGGRDIAFHFAYMFLRVCFVVVVDRRNGRSDRRVAATVRRSVSFSEKSRSRSSKARAHAARITG